MFVGERFEFRCGGRKGYWKINGNPIGQTEPMAIFSGIATTDLEGQINCTNADGTVEYSSSTLTVYGERFSMIWEFIRQNDLEQLCSRINN